MEQPTNEELRQALMWFMLADADKCDEQRALLAELRDKRSTWFDRDELDLRRSIDEVLDAERADDRARVTR